MKKGLFVKISLLFSLVLVCFGCTSLDYVGEDVEQVKTTNFNTKEDFIFKTVQKQLGYVDVSIGISETPLEDILVLYVGIVNNSNETKYKFSISDIKAKSPIGEISFILPSNYINSYQSYHASQYTSLSNASSTLNGFASIQNMYLNTPIKSSTVPNNDDVKSETKQWQQVISGIQNHGITSYKYIEPNSSDYFYIFMRKSEEYPIEITYKNLSYKFGGQK